MRHLTERTRLASSSKAARILGAVMGDVMSAVMVTVMGAVMGARILGGLPKGAVMGAGAPSSCLRAPLTFCTAKQRLGGRAGSAHLPRRCDRASRGGRTSPWARST